MRVGRCQAVLYGGLAQLGEHLPYKQRVGGSIPSSSTIIFLIICDKGQRLLKHKTIIINLGQILYFELLAQLVEHLTFNQRVAGSNPA